MIGVDDILPLFYHLFILYVQLLPNQLTGDANDLGTIRLNILMGKKMKKLVSLMTIITFALVSYTSAQDVAVVYDAALENGNVLGAVGLKGKDLADLLIAELSDKNLNAEIVDANGLIEYMNANPTGIYVLTQGNTPDTIFQNKGEEDPIYSWLREGGIGGFIGDYPFYYYWDFGVSNRVTAEGAGQQKIFGVTVTNGNAVTVSPTDLGKEYIPSLKSWLTNRPVGISVLENNNFEFESYADDGANADPVAYRTEDMKGWFINFHTSCCGTAIPPFDQIATSYAELIANRFAPESQSVDPKRKVSVVWGELKSLK